MKKATKILTLILIVVFVLGVFASCGLIGKDVANYRATTVMKVGNEQVSVGKLLDTFNSYYNNYYYYIAYGYMTIDDLFEMVISALQQQYMQIDDYVNNHEPVTASLKGKAHNAEYLTAEEFEYCVKYITLVSFQSFDQSLETKLAAKRELNDAETEDTSRDFTEYDDLNGAKSYAQYMFEQNFDSKEADEYFEKYYGDGVSFAEVNINSYVYAEETEEAKARVQEFNDRIDDEDDYVTFEELKDAQQKVLNQYSDTIWTNYGITIEKFLAGQLDDMVSSCILAKWSYEQYQDMEKEEDITSLFQKRYNIAKAAQEADYNLQDNFDDFITSLSSSSYLYSVPEKYEKQYVFVKNILIPFTSDQTALLKNLADLLGDTDSEQYIQKRNEEAAKILAEYFYSDKYDEEFEKLFDLTEVDDEDSDSKYEKLADLFTVSGGNISINESGALAPFFKGGKVVVPDTLNSEGINTAKDVVIELMKRFNTDTAQHTSQYDYVVYVGEGWEKDYEHRWVKEFYTAVNEVVQANPDDVADKYAICVSSFGVHIIYIEDYVENFVFEYDFNDRLDTKSDFYRWFKSEFESEVSERTQDKLDELEAKYIDEGKISVTKAFDKFLETNEFSFNLSDYLKKRREELD